MELAVHTRPGKYRFGMHDHYSILYEEATMSSKKISFPYILNTYSYSFLTVAMTLSFLFLCVVYNVPAMKWNLTEIDSPITGFLMVFGLQSVSIIWIALIAGAGVVSVLALGYWAGKRYSSTFIRYSVIMSFIIIELLGVPASEYGAHDDSGNYVWNYTYSYSTYTWVMQSRLTDLVMAVATYDSDNDGSADFYYVAIIWAAFLTTLFPHGWVVGLFMLLCAMYWSCWSQDFLPTVFKWIFRRYAYE